MQKRIVLKNCGRIDPKDIHSYLAKNGFAALNKAQQQMTPEQVIEEVIASGLLGRGGAGFSCGLKWKLAREQAEKEKFIICNADEGEVGTFKDRYILENDPFTLIEALAIAGWAIGAAKAIIYLRAEYHFLSGLVLNAIRQARKRGFLKHLEIELREGAGAYMCGEESGLMNSHRRIAGGSALQAAIPARTRALGKTDGHQ